MTTAVHPLPALPLDDRRGTMGMWMFILTEASLFVMLFFAYGYLGRDERVWPLEQPKLLLPFLMLAVLLTSSVILHWGEREHARGRQGRAKPAVGITVLLGVVFLGIQAIEYADKLRKFTPTSHTYGSIFYTITGFHAAHVMLGLCMLVYVLLLPALEPTDRPPHRPLHNASLYWHFVDAVWIVIVATLYVAPHLQR